MSATTTVTDPAATVPDITIRFVFKWKLLLAPEENGEHGGPYVHFHLSTNFSTDIHEVELEQAAGQMNMSLGFSSSSRNAADVNLLRNLNADQLLAMCDLNVKFFSRTENNYREAVGNPAGSCIVPLHALHDALYEGRDGLVEKDITLHMIHVPRQKSKGTAQFRSVNLPVGGKVAPISLRGQPAVPSLKFFKKRVQTEIDRAMHMSSVNALFIEATEALYERINPTLKTVARINSAIWVSSAGVFPPIAYCVDVVQPHIPVSFFENCLHVVLERNRLTGIPKEWNITGDRVNPEHVLIMENLCGQLLCSYVIHCVYRSDFVYVFDPQKKKFEKVGVEDFGDVSVDRGRGGMMMLLLCMTSNISLNCYIFLHRL
jgi:hypothetical protein